MSERDPEGSSGEPPLSAAGAQPVGEADAPGPPAPSLELLTESILRRIMRVACALGAIGIAAAIFSPKELQVVALSVAVVGIVGLFAMTFVPMRVRLLSVVFPWALVIVGGTIAISMGPRPDAFLLIAGGIIVGSLVLSPRALSLLGVGTASFLAISIAAQPGPLSPEASEVWSSSVCASLGVIVPAGIAGRMLLNALSRALRERQALVLKVMAEQRTLRQTVQALESTQTQLTHAQKLELVSQMAGGIAHDMNNALTAVIAEASLLDDAVSEERERIVEAGAYAAKLTQQLMVFSRRDVSQARAIDLVATFKELLQSVRRLLPSDVRIELDLPAQPLAILADPTRLLQVILNLAGNARDAMATGGTLSLRVWHDQPAEQAVIVVADTGSGIPEAALPRIFEPFFTTKPAGKGTGLGLANVKQIVESLRGQISVRSTLGQGTTFEVRIPTTDLEVRQDREQVAKRAPVGGTVLVVDDDVRVRAVVFSVLGRAGYRVLEAHSPSSARQRVQAERGRVDLVVTDVVMPEGGGAEVIRLLRADVPSIRVLVTSGYTDDEALRRGIAAGEFPFLPKPFTAEALEVAVACAMAPD